MANTKSKIKQGMGGSSSGKNRSEHTEVLKAETKKRRRLEGKVEVEKEIPSPMKTLLLILTLSTTHAQESAYVKNLLNVTLTEYNQYANYKETDPVLCKQIQNYWAVVGNTSAKCNDDFPWSAVFISYCVKQAGATSSEFLFAESHAAFVKQAIANADKNVGVFRAVPVASYVPKLGDIVQKNRNNKAK